MLLHVEVFSITLTKAKHNRTYMFKSWALKVQIAYSDETITIKGVWRKCTLENRLGLVGSIFRNSLPKQTDWLDPAVADRVRAVLKDTLIVQPNEVLHQAVDNHTKTEYYRLPIILHNMVMHSYRKIQTSIQFTRVYSKDKVKESDILALDWKEIVRHSKRGQKYIDTYSSRMKNRSSMLQKKTNDQKVYITPPKNFSTKGTWYLWSR